MLTLVRSTAPSIPEEDEDRPIRKSVLMRADAEATYDGPIPQEVKDAIAEQQRIERIQDRITAIDRTARTVTLAGGTVIGYDHLVLALGARNRVPQVPGIIEGLRNLVRGRM